MDIGAIFLLDDFLRNVRFFFPFISRTLPCYFPIGIFKNIFALCFACLIVCSVVLLCFFSGICRFFFFRCFAGSGILFDLSWMKVYFNAWKLGRCISVPHFSLICLCLFIKTTNLDHGCACMHPQLIQSLPPMPFASSQGKATAYLSLQRACREMEREKRMYARI